MTGGKKERLNLEIKLLGGASPVVVGKKPWPRRWSKRTTSDLPLPLPWRDLSQVFVWQRRERLS